MRLWHKDLVTVLPRQQLLGQWRECCLIAKNISENGTPNHILVNKIMDYPLEDFVTYTMKVYAEMCMRGYLPDWDNRFGKWFDADKLDYTMMGDRNDIFEDWHNSRYLVQCYYNLEEKYDNNGITEDEWKLIRSVI